MRIRFQRESGWAAPATGLSGSVRMGQTHAKRAEAPGERHCADQRGPAGRAGRQAPMPTYKVGYIVGSLATASINRTLAKALIRLAPPELEVVEVPIKDLPLYSYDYDADYPAEGRALKDALASVDAVLFVTPEYNRSIPGGLKNAIHWASRPPRQNSFTANPP